MIKQVTEQYDVVVCGGGLAGLCAAIAAARGGARTCLVQDRPVLGGNSSSEVRVTPHGASAFHGYARETGIISELLIEERAANHEEIFENGWTNSVWDLIQYDLVQRTENLTLHLNTNVLSVSVEGRELRAVHCRVGNAEVDLTLKAKVYIDCTGDGIVAAEAGCEWRMGSEGKGEFDEPHASATASADVMGNSLHFKARDMGRPTPFKLPDWAVHHEDGRFFYDQGRIPKEIRGGYWWIEIGVPYDTIHDAEKIRHELTRHTLGVWDWIKNKDPKTIKLAENFALDWIGQVPGKRESRRIMGRYLMTEWDAIRCTVHEDEIAFGGWFIDLHTPGGLLAATSEPSSVEGYAETSEYAVRSYAGPYGIPLRMLISKDMDNLMMAGRNVSATHCALATVRVMATTALMGQAVGVTAAIAVKQKTSVPEISVSNYKAVQQQLLRDGCFLPNVQNEDPEDKARLAKVIASSEAKFAGLSPESVGVHTGLNYWGDQAVPLKQELLYRRGQWVGLGGEPIRKIRFCLSNHSENDQVVGVRVMKVQHIWDYRISDDMEIACGEINVPQGEQQWIEWEVPIGTTLQQSGYIRVDLIENPHVVWHVAGAIEPGHISAFQIAPKTMRRYSSGVTLALQVDPPQFCFSAKNVISGKSRPHDRTHLWRSDPLQQLPQWIELRWERPQALREVQLTFPGHLLREYHAYAPHYRDPQCARDYIVQAEIADEWTTIANIADNYHRMRRHTLETSVTASVLRILILATHGDPSAAVYEIRAY